MTTSSDRQPLFCHNTFYRQFISVNFLMLTHLLGVYFKFIVPNSYFHVLSDEWALHSKTCNLSNVWMVPLCLEWWTSHLFIQLRLWASSYHLQQICLVVPFQVCIRGPAFYSHAPRSCMRPTLNRSIFFGRHMHIRTCAAHTQGLRAHMSLYPPRMSTSIVPKNWGL